MIPAGPDVALRAVGLALASVSIAFAGHMLLFGDGKVHVLGMEHLAIFAMPRGPTTVVAAPPPPPKDVVDMAMVGALVETAPVPAPPSKPEIVAARPDRVWILSEGKIVAAAPGDEVAGLGRIGAIVRREGAWAVLDGDGGVLLTLTSGANGVTLFKKTRIFD
jgi:hypothetical protein